jgi:hypothetical protein
VLDNVDATLSTGIGPTGFASGKVSAVVLGNEGDKLLTGKNVPLNVATYYSQIIRNELVFS